MLEWETNFAHFYQITVDPVLNWNEREIELCFLQ